MDVKLLWQAVAKFLAGVLLTGVLVFVPAGTIRFLNGWILMGILFVPMFMAGLFLIVRSPDLLKKRLASKEKESEQKVVVALSGLMFLASFILAGLDFRFGWTSLPGWAVWTGAVIFILAYLMYAEVMRENAYLSRTIEVQEGQKVVDTGLYGIVRHPMYSATVFLFLSMPVILGSVISFAVMLLYIPILSARMKNEEKVLSASIQGYREYMQKVRYRVIPYLW